MGPVVVGSEAKYPLVQLSCGLVVVYSLKSCAMYEGLGGRDVIRQLQSVYYHRISNIVYFKRIIVVVNEPKCPFKRYTKKENVHKNEPKCPIKRYK